MRAVADWSGIVVPELLELDQFALGQTIAEAKELHGLDEVVKLSWNEKLFGSLPGMLDAVRAELDNLWLYPEQPYLDFREHVAVSTGTSPANVVPAHGSLALIGLVASMLLRPGVHVVVPALTYGLYAQICTTRGATVHRVPMRELALDLDALAARAREVDARIVWICDPNNPTGFALEPEEWTAFLDAVPERCVVVVDEAYGDFVPPERRVRREQDVADGRVVVLRSISKLYGLAGLRLGYALVDASLVPYSSTSSRSRSTSTASRLPQVARVCVRRRPSRRGGEKSPLREPRCPGSSATPASSRFPPLRTSCSPASTSTTWSSPRGSRSAASSYVRVRTTASRATFASPWGRRR